MEKRVWASMKDEASRRGTAKLSLFRQLSQLLHFSFLAGLRNLSLNAVGQRQNYVVPKKLTFAECSSQTSKLATCLCHSCVLNALIWHCLICTLQKMYPTPQEKCKKHDEGIRCFCALLVYVTVPSPGFVVVLNQYFFIALVRYAD